MRHDLDTIRHQHREQVRAFKDTADRRTIRQDVAKRAKTLRQQQDRAALDEALDWASRAGLHVRVR
jgi:hypothetical protein